MSSWARPGVKCVCIFDGNRGVGVPNNPPPPMFKELTIVCVIASYWGDGLSLVIDGYPNCTGGEEFGWHISRFRPLITRTQEDDVALVRELLTGLPVEVDA